MTYARETFVNVDQSKKEIERLLEKYGATKFFTGWDAHEATVGFSMADRFVQFTLPLPREVDYLNTPTGKRRSIPEIQKAHAQAERSSWRALLLVIKAKLESVESGIETFEEAFLAQVMIRSADGGTTTVGKVMIPQIDVSYRGGQPMLALPSGKENGG